MPNPFEDVELQARWSSTFIFPDLEKGIIPAQLSFVIHDKSLEVEIRNN